METMSSEHLSAAIKGNGVYTHRGHVTAAPYYIDLVLCMAPIFQGLHGQGDSYMVVVISFLICSRYKRAHATRSYGA